MLMALALCTTLLPAASLAEWNGSATDTAWYNTDDTEFSITTEGELAGLAKIVNGTAEEISQDSFSGKTITLAADIDLAMEEWTPVGDKDNPFKGKFDGGEHEIKKLGISSSDDNQGLFGYVENAEICNVTLSEIIVSGDTNVGGIAGTAVSSTISGCRVVNTEEPNENYSWGVRGRESVGGIVGSSEDSRIVNCENSGTSVYLLISGDYEQARHKLGGIAGVALLSSDACTDEDAVLISSCKNSGRVICTTEANYECTGGIVGRVVSENADYRAVVEDCTNTGVVSSIEAGTGGIVGYAQNASIEGCENKAEIKGTTGVGGIAGYAYYGTQILSCNNSGSVTGNVYDSGAEDEDERVVVYPYNIGGIVGSVYNPRDTSHLHGDCDRLPVYSYNRDSLISSCENSGEVSCAFEWPEALPTVRFVDDEPCAVNIFGAFVGGIAGFAVDSAYFEEEGNTIRIEDCENSGGVSGSSYAGGILGIGKNAELEGCVSTGTVADEDASDTDSIRADVGGFSYTVRFDANGGTVEAQDTLTLANYGVLDSLPTPERRGSYSFDGWYTSPRGGERVESGTVFDESSTVYAHWTYTGADDDYDEPVYSVTVSGTENGSVTVSPRYAECGESVTITVKPDEGFKLASLSVFDQNGDELELTYKGNGRYALQMPDGKVTVEAEFAVDNTALSLFEDVTADKYYYEAVLWAARSGIAEGVDENHFAPESCCTRAQLAALLYRYAQSQGGGFTGAWMFRLPFTDVPEWCSEAVAWCYMNGIVSGYGNGLFGTDDLVTREQAATILHRFAEAMSFDVSVGEDTNILSYNDVFSISDYAIEAFQWTVGAGIMHGADGCLMPKESCTRAQLVTMLYRMLGE